jgi:hypothetical protein
MLIGFGALLLVPGEDSSVFDNPLWILVIIGALWYIYAVRCRCPRCGKSIGGIYARVPPACPWCGLSFDAPWPRGSEPDRHQESP